MVSNIWVIHICPETNGAGEILPHSFVFPDAFLTFVDKRYQTIFFDLLFAVQSQHLFYFQLNRKSVGIPSGFTRNHFPLHSMITWNHVLDYTSQYVTNMWLTICCWRSIIECVSRAFFTIFHTFFKNVILFPELFHIFFSLNKIEIGRYFLVHDIFPFCIYLDNVTFYGIWLAILQKKLPSVKGRELVIPPVTLLDTSDCACISAPCNGGIRQNLVCSWLLISILKLRSDLPSVLLSPDFHLLRLAVPFTTNVLSSSWFLP